jgi:hypothetical protein
MSWIPQWSDGRPVRDRLLVVRACSGQPRDSVRSTGPELARFRLSLLKTAPWYRAARSRWQTVQNGLLTLRAHDTSTPNQRDGRVYGSNCPPFSADRS